jgi:hypothetical protein
MFRKEPGKPLLPAPQWGITIFLWNSSTLGWNRDVTADGDVEKNPGPDPAIPFAEFVTEGLDEFIASVPPQDLTRQTLTLRHCIKASGGTLEDILPEVQAALGPVPSSYEFWKVIAVYELFSGAQMCAVPSGGWTFKLPESPLSASHTQGILFILGP